MSKPTTTPKTPRSVSPRLLKVGQLLKGEREFRGKTVEQVAATLGISKQAVSQIENGKSNCTLERWAQFAAAVDAEFEVRLLDATLQVVVSRKD